MPVKGHSLKNQWVLKCFVGLLPKCFPTCSVIRYQPQQFTVTTSFIPRNSNQQSTPWARVTLASHTQGCSAIKAQPRSLSPYNAFAALFLAGCCKQTKHVAMEHSVTRACTPGWESQCVMRTQEVLLGVSLEHSSKREVIPKKSQGYDKPIDFQKGVGHPLGKRLEQ